MDVYFRDENLNTVGIVDDYIQMMWEEKLRGEGTLTIELPNTPKYRSMLSSATLVTIKESRRCMLIDSVNYKITGDYAHIIVNGVPVEQFLKHRWCQAKSMNFWWRVAACANYERQGLPPYKDVPQNQINPLGLAPRAALDDYTIREYDVTKAWYQQNSESIARFRSKTTSYLNDFACYILGVYLEGWYDSRLAIPRFTVNRRIQNVDGSDYNNTPGRDYNRTAFDDYRYTTVPSQWTVGRDIAGKESQSNSQTQAGISAWDLAVAGANSDHFEIRFDDTKETLELVHVSLKDQDPVIWFSPELENIDSAEYTEYRFKEPTHVFGYMNLDDTYDGHLLLSGFRERPGTGSLSGYKRIEQGMKLDPPEKTPTGKYYGIAIMYGKKWTDLSGNDHLDRDVVLKHDYFTAGGTDKAWDAYCTVGFSTVDPETKKTVPQDVRYFSGGGITYLEEDIPNILEPYMKAQDGLNRAGTVSAVPLFGFEYNKDYHIGDIAEVVFAAGEAPVKKNVRVTGYNWNVTNGSVVHHPIFEAL